MQDKPQEAIERALPQQSKAGSDTHFFSVSPVKLVVMSLFTLGLYELYWHYQQWKSIKLRNGSNISPFWRAFFGYFFCYALFCEVRGRQASGAERISAGLLALGWIVFSCMWRLPDPLSMITMASVLFLVPVQKAINDINRTEAPGRDPNAKIRGANWIAIVIGGALLVLALLGAFLPDATNY